MKKKINVKHLSVSPYRSLVVWFSEKSLFPQHE